MSGFTPSTGNEIMNQCLSDISGSDVAESTASTYQSSLRKFSYYLDENDLSAFETDVSELKSFLRNQADQGLLESTIQGDKAAIKKLYKYIYIDTSYEAELRLALVDEISGFSTPPKLDVEPLSLEELEKLFEAAKSRRDRLMMVVGGETGARNESLRLIRMRDIDLTENEIRLNNTKTGGTYTVPISSEVALELDRWTAMEREQYTCKPNSNYLFPGKTTEKLDTRSSFLKIVQDAAERAGIQKVIFEREASDAEKRSGAVNDKKKFYHVTPHSLRHTFSYMLEKAGLTTRQRSDALGHKNISTTEKYYTYIDSNYYEKIRELLHN